AAFVDYEKCANAIFGRSQPLQNPLQTSTLERGQRNGGYERFMAIRQSRSKGTALTLAKDGRKRRTRVKSRLAAFVLCATSLLSGQAMKIERSGYEPEIKTNLMVATVVTNPNIHYLLTCSPDRHDCELLLAGERYDFTPAPER